MTTVPEDPVFDGSLLYRGEPGYETARNDAIWNGRKTGRYPSAILLAASETDVVAGVRLAISRDWRISIRSGGHSWVGTGIRNDVLLIDLSALDDIVLDTAGLSAQVQPAARGVDLNRLLDENGLVFPTGHCPSVAVGGFLLGGGYGWNSRQVGPACMSIEAIDVVLADGTLVHADDESHPELMWAARGAGPGFFGIVTRFYLRVRPAYTRILMSSYLFPASMRDEVLAFSYEVLPNTSRSLEMCAKIAYDGPGEEITCRLLAFAFCTNSEDAEMFEPVEAAPFLDRAISKVERRETNLQELYDRSELGMPKGKRYAVDGVWTSAPVSEIIDAGRDILDVLPSRDSFMFWMLWGDYPEQPNASWSTQGQLYFSPNAIWIDPADDLENELWAHHSLTDLNAIGVGTQYSDANPADRPDRGMEPAQAERLEQLRDRFDPAGRFCSYLTPDESTTALGRYLQAQR